MRKIVSIFILLLLAYSSFSQTVPFPNYHYSGSVTTIETERGFFQPGIGLRTARYSDTTQANTNPYLKYYPGALIVVVDTTFMRDATAQFWINTFSSGGGGGTVTADNGLRMSTATNVQLGGTSAPGEALLHDTYINNGVFTLNLTGTIANLFRVDNTSALAGRRAILATSVNSNAVYGTSTGGEAIVGASTDSYGGSFTSSNADGLLGSAASGIGVVAASTSGFGLQTTSTSGVALRAQVTPTSTNSLVTVGQLIRSSSGTAADGIGGSLDFYNKAASGGSILSNRVASIWTDATAQNSRLEIYGTNSGSSARKLAILNTGQIVGDAYGDGLFVSTSPRYLIGVDGNGNYVEVDTSIGASAVPTWEQTLSVSGGNILSTSHTVGLSTGRTFTMGSDGGDITFSAGGASVILQGNDAVSKFSTVQSQGDEVFLSASDVTQGGHKNDWSIPADTTGDIALLYNNGSANQYAFTRGTPATGQTFIADGSNIMKFGSLDSTNISGLHSEEYYNTQFGSLDGSSKLLTSQLFYGTLVNGYIPIFNASSGHFEIGGNDAWVIGDSTSGNGEANIYSVTGLGQIVYNAPNGHFFNGDSYIGNLGLENGSGALGTMYYVNGSGILTPLLAGTDKQHLTIRSGIPAWVDTAAAGGSGITINTTTITGGTSGNLLYDNAGTVGKLAVVPIANGGTNNGSLSVTAGNILYTDGSKAVGLATGTAKQSFHPNGSGSYVWRDTSVNKSVGLQALPTLTFSGTRPTTGDSSYTWTQKDKEVTINFNAVFTNAGATNTSMTFALPSDMPLPLEPTGLGAADNTLYTGAGVVTTSITNISTSTGRCFLKVNAADNGYEIVVAVAAGVSAKAILGSLTYTAQ